MYHDKKGVNMMRIISDVWGYVSAFFLLMAFIKAVKRHYKKP
jgi:hypothetical protein